MSYNHKEIEKKWQKYWDEKQTFKTPNPWEEWFDKAKPKYYVLDMFPYPSGAGLHVGHPKGYTANDIIARYFHAKWYNVLHPMGWDAFGLPAENYAIKTWTHPKITTEKNVNHFREQIKSLWMSYDWSREINTTDPKYYKWTQWIFLKMFEHGLAYEQNLPINYCPSCKTGLANEEVLKDWTCERCGAKVIKKPIRQWVLAITKYADRLAKDVDKLDWPEGIKDMQKNWIGRSEWTEFKMDVVDKNWNKIWEISVYTTRIDTVFWMSYAVIAPEHKDVEKFIQEEQKEACENYIEQAKMKSDLDRTADNKEKTWVFTGSYVVNPYNWEKVPLWIADYVLGHYGTGAVMAVPAHDERDFEFAKKYNLPIKQVIVPKNNEEVELPFTEYGILINSWKFSWLTSEQAKKELTSYAGEKWFGHKKVNYKLRDWIFSRQRYWWEPIPLIHLKDEDIDKLPVISDLSQAKDLNLAYILKRPEKEWENVLESAKCPDTWLVRELVIWWKVFSKIYDGLEGKIVCDYNLPLELPEVEKYEPAGDGQSPLARIDDWVNVKLADNLSWKRETNTMPQWWWSCWYYLRYMDPHNDEQIVNPEIEKYWGSVDSYVWGAEHAVLHLLYARFWHKFLYDIGVVSTDEPFYRLRNQWLILAYAYQKKNWGLVPVDLVEERNWKYYHKETWEELEKVVAKMSKSLKNVVNPDDIVNEYGADSLRLYEMYMSDFKDAAPWDTKGIIWVRRFLDKVARYFIENQPKLAKNDNEAIRLLHKSIKKVSSDIENYKFNTAIAQLMILLNYWIPKDKNLAKQWKENFIKLLHPFAPHLAEEIYQNYLDIENKKESVFFEPWPEYDENLAKDDVLTIAIQVMWKLRWTIQVPADASREEILEKAKQEPNVKKWIAWKNIVKEIYIPGKLVNLVVK
jgi:leucyl-tRNA synthetase